MDKSLIRQVPILAGKQESHLVMTYAMRRSLFILQIPILELKEWINTEIEKNPLLEIESNSLESSKEEFQDEKEIDFSKDPFKDKEDPEFLNVLFQKDTPSVNVIEKKEANISIFESLMIQAHENFRSYEEIKLAEHLIGNLDEKGFFSGSVKELANTLKVKEEKLDQVLAKIQTFEPIGIGSKNLQECLLIQLKARKKQKSLAYKIVKKYFQDLVHNRILLLAKKTRYSPKQIQTCFQKDLKGLVFCPKLQYEKEISPILVPDVILKKDEKGWKIEVNEEDLPIFRFNLNYLKLLKEKINRDEKNVIRNFVTSGKSLIKSLQQRKNTLKKITQLIVKSQKGYLNHQKEILPLNVKKVAQEIGVHESTVARAISQKYLECPRGIFPLKIFFSSSQFSKQKKKFSKFSIKDVLENIVQNEDKSSPLSDLDIAKELEKKGIPCARRTVAKYRQKLKIGSAKQRKLF